MKKVNQVLYPPIRLFTDILVCKKRKTEYKVVPSRVGTRIHKCTHVHTQLTSEQVRSPTETL